MILSLERPWITFLKKCGNLGDCSLRSCDVVYTCTLNKPWAYKISWVYIFIQNENTLVHLHSEKKLPSWPPAWTQSSTSDCLFSFVFLNTLRPRQNGRHFPYSISNAFSSWMKMDEFWLIFLWSLFPVVQFTNIPALDQIMAWHRPGDKPLSETMMLSLLTHICITQPSNSRGVLGVEGNTKIIINHNKNSDNRLW